MNRTTLIPFPTAMTPATTTTFTPTLSALPTLVMTVVMRVEEVVYEEGPPEIAMKDFKEGETKDWYGGAGFLYFIFTHLFGLTTSDELYYYYYYEYDALVW